MKKMRKIIPAFAMLLVSAIMMSTATFAWFSANTQAKASGMQIKAQTSGGLAIASWTTGSGNAAVEPLDENFVSEATVDWKNGDGVIAPTSHSGTAWYKASAASVNSYEKDGEYTAITTAEEPDYFLMSKWDFKTLAEGKQADVILSAINVTNVGTSTVNVNLAKSMRIAIKSGATWYYFAPQYTSGTFYYVEEVGSTPTRTAYGSTGAATITLGTTPGVTILEDVNSTTAQTIEVYIYFEGEDANCMSANAVDLKDIGIQLVFVAGAFSDVTP